MHFKLLVRIFLTIFLIACSSQSRSKTNSRDYINAAFRAAICNGSELLETQTLANQFDASIMDETRKYKCDGSYMTNFFVGGKMNNGFRTEVLIDERKTPINTFFKVGGLLSSVEKSLGHPDEIDGDKYIFNLDESYTELLVFISDGVVKKIIWRSPVD